MDAITSVGLSLSSQDPTRTTTGKTKQVQGTIHTRDKSQIQGTVNLMEKKIYCMIHTTLVYAFRGCQQKGDKAIRKYKPLPRNGQKVARSTIYFLLVGAEC